MVAKKKVSTELAEPAFSYLRETVNRYQRESSVQREKSWQELSANKKWLHWEEVIQVVCEQRNSYESEIDAEPRARESQDYGILLLYTAIPPGRCKEYRTLRLQVAGEGDTASQLPAKVNVLRVSEGGGTAKLHLADYKTVNKFGKQIIDISSVEFLLPHLVTYIHKDRRVLLRNKADHGYLFMDTNGDPFTEQRWTKHIQDIFKEHSGVSLGSTNLRASFVTYLLNDEVGTGEQISQRIADAMRHSVTSQRQIYDRRTTEDRTREAVRFASEITTQALGDSMHTNLQDEHDDTYEKGDIVAAVCRTSTKSDPDFVLGKILRTYAKKREAILAHLEPVPRCHKKYKLAVGQGSWTESYDALIYPLDVVYKEDENAYVLRTTPEEIHQCWRDTTQ